MDFVTKNKTTLIALAIVLAGAAVYFFFFRSTEPESTNGLSTFGNSEIQVANQQFIALFGRLQRVEFETGILEDPQFVGLVDFSQPITPEPIGRSNPFAPTQ